jgi:hypothetical protein
MFSIMPRILPAILAVFIITLVASCDKDPDGPDEESILHGTWVKGSNTGDTLVFYGRGGKHYMKSNQSFNPTMYAPVEQEYVMRNGKPAFRYLGTGVMGRAEFTIESFTWKVPGREFELLGFQLYMFMSSSQTKFTFVKVL